MLSGSNIKLNYRPDIDGLRAISIIGVIFFHLKFILDDGAILKGGFFGVDIFFVISGYLITSLILKEIKYSEKFSIIGFYKRRIRRILPVFLVVIISVIPFAYILYLPTELISFSKSILYALGLISNYFFLIINAEYFTPEIIFQGMLHTWSLAVEEQFYILFPFIISIVYLKNKKNFIIIFSILFFISLISARIGTIHHKSEIFYITLFRIFEFIPGSILAFMEIDKEKKLKNNNLEKILPLFGFILIICSFIFFSEKTRHPSFETLIPILGTCLIIWYKNENSLFYKFISNKFFVYIGLISFSLYLWHYPIFTLISISEFSNNDLFKKILICLLTIPLSIASYLFIEKTFRNKNISFNKVLIFIFILTAIIVVFSIKAINSNGFMSRYNITNYYNLDPKIDSDLRKKYLIDYYNENHLLDKEKILIVGNSHADDNLNILSRNDYLNEKYLFLRPFSQVYEFWLFLNGCDECSNEKKNNYTELYNSSNKIILATKWYEKDLTVINDILNKLKNDNKNVLIIDNTLIFDQKTKYNFNELDYFVFKNKRIPNVEEMAQLEKNAFAQLKNSTLVNKTLEEIANKNNIKLLKKSELLCDKINTSCKILTENGYKIYLDTGHLTNEGAKYFSSKKYINELFK